MKFNFIEDLEQRTKAEADYKVSLEEAIATEVNGLKLKNADLITEKQAAKDSLADQIAKTEGIDIEKAREAMALLDKTKRKDLLEEGKLDEYIQVEVQNKQREIEKQYSSQLEISNQERDSITKTAVKYEGLFKNKIMEDNIREVAMKSGCKPDEEVIRDIITRGKTVFSLNGDESGIEAKNEDGSFKKSIDGDKILTPEAWIDDLKKQCPYYFPESNGTGASGESSFKSGGSNALAEQISQALQNKDFDLYRVLRKKQGANLK